MAHLYRDLSVKSLYSDRKFMGGKAEWQEAIKDSTTLYVGNLSFYTTEEQLYELFGRCGDVKRIVMGLDRFAKTPCGFCFVEYFYRSDTEDAMRYVTGLKLDDRIIRVDWDGGFIEGRQYGRGRSGGQVRDEYRTDFDAGRGGWGKAEVNQMPLPPAPRRRSDAGVVRRDAPGADSRGKKAEPAPQAERPEPSAKRSKVEANPRFREVNEDDDDDD
mmetsp:Transcript_55950/g.121788  ORF Transcript_55950/g.121788 Transcript_55950/m.121788 type:complete len:216 (+) Transcript_55950:479-1126(+)